MLVRNLTEEYLILRSKITSVWTLHLLSQFFEKKYISWKSRTLPACLVTAICIYLTGVDSTLFKDIGYLISAAICLGTLKIYKSNHIHEKHDKPTTVSTQTLVIYYSLWFSWWLFLVTLSLLMYHIVVVRIIQENVWFTFF